MHTFFHGWRRKTGLVSLGLACVVCGMWLRSLSIHDQLYVYRKIGYRKYLSANGSFGWFGSQDFDTSQIKPLPPLALITVLARDNPNPAENPLIKWQFNWLGFGIGHSSASEELLLIPYWPVAMPLTLLSAYLILWKPRKRVKSSDQTAISKRISN